MKMSEIGIDELFEVTKCQELVPPSPPALRGRRAGDEGVVRVGMAKISWVLDPFRPSPPDPLSPEYRGEGEKRASVYAQKRCD